VGLMDFIFSRAACVMIWLGFKPSNIRFMDYGINNEFRDDFDEWVCDNPYWSRLWIIQEIGLAKDLKVFVGSRNLPWGNFPDYLPHPDEDDPLYGYDKNIRILHNQDLVDISLLISLRSC
jgi:hypothetical protein